MVVVSGSQRRYVWGLGLAYATTVNGSTVQAVYHGDGLGSVRALTDGAGVLTNSYQTDEYGVPGTGAGTSTQPFGYTGELRDAETGLVNLRARMYDPETGRLLQRDLLAGRARRPSTLNRYGYVLNNPLRYTDPSGNSSDDIGNQMDQDFHDAMDEIDDNDDMLMEAALESVGDQAQRDRENFDSEAGQQLRQELNQAFDDGSISSEHARSYSVHAIAEAVDENIAASQIVETIMTGDIVQTSRNPGSIVYEDLSVNQVSVAVNPDTYNIITVWGNEGMTDSERRR